MVHSRNKKRLKLWLGLLLLGLCLQFGFRWFVPLGANPLTFLTMAEKGPEIQAPSQQRSFQLFYDEIKTHPEGYSVQHIWLVEHFGTFKSQLIFEGDVKGNVLQDIQYETLQWHESGLPIFNVVE